MTITLPAAPQLAYEDGLQTGRTEVLAASLAKIAEIKKELQREITATTGHLQKARTALEEGHPLVGMLLSHRITLESLGITADLAAGELRVGFEDGLTAVPVE